MSALGNYVHYTWSGYTAAGTYHDESHWKGAKKQSNQTISDYSEDGKPFLQFQNYISKKAQFKKYNIAELEKAYNTQRLEQFKAFQELSQQKPESFLQLMKIVVETADIGMNPSELAPLLVLDKSNQSIAPKYKEALGESKEVKKIRQLAKGTDKSFSYLNTVWNACKIARTIVDHSPSKSVLDSKLYKLEVWIQNTEKRLAALNKEENKINKFGYGYVKSQSKGAKEAGKLRATLPRKAARAVLSRIIDIASAADFSSRLKALQGAFTEVMGASLRPMVRRLAVEEIGDIFGSSKSRPGTSNQAGVDIYFDQIEMNKLLEEERKKNKAEQFQIFTEDKAGRATFKVDYETKNKKDFVLEWEGTEMGVSAKSYNLDVTEIYDSASRKKIPSYIGLQSGTSLLIYLLNFEQNQSRLGTHFLNIFAYHGDPNTKEKVSEGTEYTKLKQIAEDSLMIAMLYNGLTGDLSGKTSDTFADILMIEDKSKSLAPGVYRVKFYNVSTIVSNVLNNIETYRNKIHVSPNLNTLRLNNPWSDSPKKRITQLLLDARTKKFTVGINIKNLKDFREP